MNKKRTFIILAIIIFLSLTSVIGYAILSYLNSTRNTSEHEPQRTKTSNELKEQDSNIINRLSDCVTLVDLASLPKDNIDYSSYNNYYVSTSGNDSNEGTLNNPFATISHALEVAEDKSVVYVRGGNYKTENLQITHSNFVLSAYENEKVTLTPLVNNDQWDMDEDLALLLDGDLSNIVIDGITIDGFEQGIIYGDSQTQENIILKNITIKDATIGVENIYPNHDKYLVKGLLIRDVTMTNITGIGLQCGDEQENCAENVLIQNVQIFGSDNNKDDTAYDSLAMVNSDNILVIDSTFTNAPGDGLDFKSTRVAVVNTVVGKPNRNGMKFWHEGEIINSIIYATGADASLVFDSDTPGSKLRLINSIVAQHLYDLPQDERHAYAVTIGYDEQESYTIELLNNIFYDMPGPIYINSQSLVNIFNNIFYKFIHDDRFLVYGKDDFDNISELNQRDYADSNQYIDPKFSDPSSHNWTVTQDSPAIDAGIGTNGIPDFDMVWQDRPRGSEVDIGPYER